ncbi:MAG: glutamate synthase-related protein [Thermoplasmata archaeon]|nr:glutamate synthase-related protein [Thermoplasmata archaeon]
MYERYHIPMKIVEPRAPRIPKFTISRADNCINCGRCEQACIYGVHKRSESDPREMADPVNHLCKNCFRCIAECPQRALTMSKGAEYCALGRGVWTPLRISTIWGEAETGKIPVFGAGYRGMFSGPHFDGMWTDMSEIVRPTRDGIHGREFISTSVDIGRIPLSLQFTPSGALRTELPPLLEIPIPMVLDLTRLRIKSEWMIRGIASAAKHMKTYVFADIDSLTQDMLSDYGDCIVPVIPPGKDVSTIELPNGTGMVELTVETSWKNDSKTLLSRFPEKVVSFRVKARKGIEDTVLEMLDREVAVAHIDYDDDGEEYGASKRHASESLLAIHSKLVSVGRRDEVTVMAGGGLAAAEHVPKSIVCGADIVSLDKALLIALECRDCVECAASSCPVDIAAASSEWVEGRVMNMVGAWRDQLLEVLGAMGIREVRRLRGEVGRAIFFDRLEEEFKAALVGGGRR